MYTIGIDASNIRSGGGLSHLRNILLSLSLDDTIFKKIVVWGGLRTLSHLPEAKWLEKIHIKVLDGILSARILWQQLELPRSMGKLECDVLFSPGGILPFNISKPTVIMSQNMLPFERGEFHRFSLLSSMRIKMYFIRRMQLMSMNKTLGLIFLNNYAKKAIMPLLGRKSKHVAVIPQGLEERFFKRPRPARALESLSIKEPFKLLYVSTVDVYKHQWNVAMAVAALRKKGVPIEVAFYGGSYKPALRRLDKMIKQLDCGRVFLRYEGIGAYETLHRVYQDADAFVFASSCENFPNIILEAMASGLPIASSNRGPMPEILKNAAVYFDPEDVFSIENSLQLLIHDNLLRKGLADKAFNLALPYSWRKSAVSLLAFIEKVVTIV